MKRGMSKLLSILLIATLVFTSASVAFAGTETGQTADDTAALVKSAAVAAVQQQAKALPKSATTKAREIDGNLNLVTIASEADLDKLSTNVGRIAYYPTDVLAKGCGFAKPVQIPAKGTVFIAAAVSQDSATGAYFGLYRDAQLSDPVDAEGYASYTSSKGVDKVFQVSGAGTYYLGVRSSSFSSGYVYTAVAAGYVNGGDRTITSGKEILVGQKDEQSNYFKFKATKTGYLEVISTKDMGYNKVTLCNSKKTAISNSVDMRYAPTFGVKKGTTYYVKIAARYNSEGSYIFKATNTQVKEKSGKSKSKAVTIKKNKKVKGTITAGSKQTDWYKFKLTKDSKITRLSLTGDTNGELRAKLYNSKGKAVSGKTASISYTGSNYYLHTTGKIKKGTYYIKVYNPKKNYSGYYTLSWK